MNNNIPKWKREIRKFDRKVKLESARNRKAISKMRKETREGHTDGAENQYYSINSLSGDRTLEWELKNWRKALRDLNR